MTSLRHARPAAPGYSGRHSAPARTSEQSTARRDIQGLRALAVGLVVADHLYPHAITGGFIGVDIFFVISGYLITGLLRRDTQKTGRVHLWKFYGRRARRLLPAAVLVLTVTWIVSRLVLPVTQLPAAADQIRASALYWQNWTLASNAVDYFASNNAASPVQHFWSLSVEEQFYVFWPLIFLIPLVLAVALRRRATLALAVGLVGASLAYSVIETSSNQAAAYFVTGTRIWELGLGGLLALAPAGLVRRLSRVGVLSWVGLAAILVSAFTLDGSTPFPGAIAAIPVLGAVLLILCGSEQARLGTYRLTSLRPFVVLGDLSYGIYLWHWPIIVLWQARTSPGIGKYDGPAIVVASIVLAALTKRFVEDPIRKWPRLARSTPLSLSPVLLAVVPVVLVSVYLSGVSSGVTARVDSRHPGAAALADPGQKVPKAAAIPTLDEVHNDFAVASNEKCMTFPTETGTKSCTFGDKTNPRFTVALIGDSHAAMWSSALDIIGKQRHWRIVVETRSGCPWTTATVLASTGVPYSKCISWGRQVQKDLLQTIKPDVIIASDRYQYSVPGDRKHDAHGESVIGRGMLPYWTDMLDHHISVVALRETPEPGRDVPDCLAKNSEAACSRTRADAVKKTTALTVASQAMHGRVPLVDMTKYFCNTRTCPAIVGNVIVSRDNSHVTATYTKTMVPYLEQALLRIPSLAGS